MSDKRECVKSINISLDKIVEDFEEVLSFLKTGKATKLDEMQSLLFAKMRMSELMQNLEKIYQNLVELKYINRSFNLKFKKFEDLRGFYSYFQGLNKEFEKGESEELL